MKCKYRKQCNGYKDFNETCNCDCDKEYCGKYRKFQEENNEKI